MNEIPTNPNEYSRLVQMVQIRMQRSAAWSNDRRVEAVRFFKLWRKYTDRVINPDEPNITLGYSFALVEKLASKITEPILKMRPPCDVLPMKLGDGAQAENFKNVARNWYSKPNVQEPLSRSKKEMVIVGTRWEIDEWQNQQRKGKMWGKVPKMVQQPLMDLQGQPVMKDGQPVMSPPTQVMVDAEVERNIPIHYGFTTRYPSFFDMYPEPFRKTIGTGAPTDASWVIEDMGELAMEEMCREMYVDPADNKTKPLYDFTMLLKDAGNRAQERYAKIMQGGTGIDDNYGPLITPVKGWGMLSDYGQEDKNTQYPGGSEADGSAVEDRDKIWVVRHYQANEILTIANGKYIIQRKKDPWHVPIMPIRVECYTTDPEFLYGVGALKPIEDEIYELNDTHNLSMSQFIRIVNKMMAIQEGSIVSMADFEPRAGGKIRVRGDIDVRTAIMPIEQSNVVSEMLAMESNARGLIEFTSDNMDGSPGVQGTKQEHKTARGMELITVNMSTRFVTMQRQGLINEARRMMSMSHFFSQFAFEKMPYRLYRDDGSTALAEFNKDDIFTEGRGFEFAVEIDPTFGDTQIQRNQDLFLFDRSVEYERLRKELGDPTMRKINLDVLMEKNLRDFGYVDTTRVFTSPDNEMSVDAEMTVLMQGGTIECSGDLQEHITMHLLALNSPNLKKAVESGKAAPDTLKNLQLAISQAMAKLTTFVKDPQGAAQAKLNAVMQQPGAPQ